MPTRLAAQPPIIGPSSTATTRLVRATDSQHGGDVDRPQAAQVDHLGVDPALGQLVGRPQAVAHALGDRDQGHVGALADHRGLAQRQRLLAPTGSLTE